MILNCPIESPTRNGRAAQSNLERSKACARPSVTSIAGSDVRRTLAAAVCGDLAVAGVRFTGAAARLHQQRLAVQPLDAEVGQLDGSFSFCRTPKP